jgi:hypothetical protein
MPSSTVYPDPGSATASTVNGAVSATGAGATASAAALSGAAGSDLRSGAIRSQAVAIMDTLSADTAIRTEPLMRIAWPPRRRT